MEFKCNNVTITLKDGKVIVKDLNFILNKGDKLALIGEEGNGKSTLIKFIVNPKLINSYCYYTGNIYFKGKIGYLRQTLNDYQEYHVLEFLGLDDFEQIDYEIYNKEYLIKKLFNEFNLNLAILNNNEKITHLSGGEKVKLQLLKLQLEEVDLLVLDEPSNDLDLATLTFLENYLLSKEIPIIFVSHDEILLTKVANKILHFQQIKDNGEVNTILENLSYKDYLTLRKTKREKQNNQAYLQEKEIKHKKEVLSKVKQKVENDMKKAVRNPEMGRLLVKKMKNIKSQEKKVAKKEDNKVHYVSEDEPINAAFSSNLNFIDKNKVLVDLKNYTLKINERVLQENINLLIKGGDHFCLIGDNGSGKTTLLKKIKEMIENKEGVKVGYFSQNYQEVLDMDKNVVEYLQTNLAKDNLTKGKIMTYLSAFNFMEYELYSKIRDLSIGEQGKVLLLKLILEESNVLILDEPSRNLSVLSLPKIIEILKEFKGCIIFVSHDRYFIKEIANKIYDLKLNKYIDCL